MMVVVTYLTVTIFAHTPIQRKKNSSFEQYMHLRNNNNANYKGFLTFCHLCPIMEFASHIRCCKNSRAK